MVKGLRLSQAVEVGSVIAGAQVGQALGIRFDPAAAATHGIVIRIGASPTVRPTGASGTDMSDTVAVTSGGR
ncbi:hypothetical protein GCM10018966_000020 [Streptomyces yanii]